MLRPLESLPVEAEPHIGERVAGCLVAAVTDTVPVGGMEGKHRIDPTWVGIQSI